MEGTVESLCQSLGGLVSQIEKELGRETTLRLLWPHLIGSKLAANAELKAIRGATLVVGVPDRAWLRSLKPFEHMMLDAVNRLGSGTYESIELVEQPDMASPPPPQPAARRERASNADAAVPFDSSAIPNEELRKIFSDTAAKYLLRSQRQKEGT